MVFANFRISLGIWSEDWLSCSRYFCMTFFIITLSILFGIIVVDRYCSISWTFKFWKLSKVLNSSLFSSFQHWYVFTICNNCLWRHPDGLENTINFVATLSKSVIVNYFKVSIEFTINTFLGNFGWYCSPCSWIEN